MMNTCDATEITRATNGRSWSIPTALGRILVSLTGKPHEVKLTVEEADHTYVVRIAKKTFDAAKGNRRTFLYGAETTKRLNSLSFANADNSRVFFLDHNSVPTMMIVDGHANTGTHMSAKMRDARDMTSVVLSGGGALGLVLQMLSEAFERAERVCAPQPQFVFAG